MPADTEPSLANAQSAQLSDPLLGRQWFAIAWSREVVPGQPLARRLLATDLVLWRSQHALHCWRDLCIHRGARLSLGVIRNDNCLICPYHAWEYAPSGACVSIPAHPGMSPPPKAHAETFHVRERYGVVWVCLAEPDSPLPDFPLADTAGFRTILAGPYRFRAQGPRIIENLLDVAHLGFVHAGLLGDPARGQVEDYAVTAGSASRGPEAREIRIWQPDPDGTGNAALVHYHYWVNAPLTAGFVKNDDARRFGILAQVAPIDAEISESRLLMVLNYGDDTSDQELLRFQDFVTEQDRVVVESQRPELLPLDLQAELHLRSDRMAIAYRKWLREIGFTYGTA